MYFKRMLLPLNLQFFAEDNGAGGGEGGQQGQEGQGQGNNAGQQGNDGSQNKQQNEHMIPKSRFDEVNNSLKTLQEQLDKINNEKTQAELDAKKKNGEFEDLYTKTSQELENTKNTYKQTSERVSQLEALIQTMVDTELQSVPEAFRDLVPENLSAEQKLSWITQAKSKGLFGNAGQNNKANEPLGGATNSGQQTTQQAEAIGKMSITEMLRSAYGSKK
jgi:uncharacterized protein YoxC